MNLEEFGELLDLHGPELQRFPTAERAQAERLLSESAEARTALEEARALDVALSSLEAPEPRPALVASIASIPQRHARRNEWWPFTTVYRPMLAMAAAALLGIGVGNWTFSTAASEEISTGDFEELSALAFGDEANDALVGVDAYFEDTTTQGSTGAP